VKYAKLPDEALQEVETYFETVAYRYGANIKDGNRSQLTPAKES
jgi:hypothetical protein